MVIIEASSGPWVFIDSAPSMLSPSSICTSALASGPKPMPPYSFGTNGHHKPCARAFFRSLPRTSSSGLVSSSFSAGMHSSCTHLRTFSRIALASAGTSKSIDMTFPRSGLLMACLAGWHISGPSQRQRQTKFKARATIIPGLYGMMSASAAKECQTHVRSRRSLSRLRVRMDQHQRRAHFRARRRQGTAAIAAARLFRDPCDVAPRGAAARRQLHADHRRSAGLWLVGYAGERQGSYALHQACAAAHDRRGRVAYRLALDHPGRLSRLAVLDILPTYNYWERMNRLYALKIYHWTFLAQPFPLPETLIGGNPDFFLRQKIASQTKSKTLDAIDPRALQHYLAAFRDPSRVHAMCEDYRAGAYADFEIDKKDHDAGNKITIPMLALWGDAGIASAAATPLDTWKTWATNVSGAPVDSGHFLTEENPDATAKALREFFGT